MFLMAFLRRFQKQRLTTRYVDDDFWLELSYDIDIGIELIVNTIRANFCEW